LFDIYTIEEEDIISNPA